MRKDYNGRGAIYEVVVQAARRGGFKKEEGEALQNIANAFTFSGVFPKRWPPTSGGWRSSGSGRTMPAWPPHSPGVGDHPLLVRRIQARR